MKMLGSYEEIMQTGTDWIL